MSNPPHFKPFNLKHAKLGAPYGREDGVPIRIICWDFKGTFVDTSLIGVINTNTPKPEKVVYFNNNGTYSVANLPNMSLVMLPLLFIEGTPFFVGDKVEIKFNDIDCWVPYTVEANPPEKDEVQYRTLKPESFLFKGRELTLDSELWAREDDGSWNKVLIKNIYTSVGSAKFYLESNGFSKLFEWEKPKVMVQKYQAMFVKPGTKYWSLGCTLHNSIEECGKLFKVDGREIFITGVATVKVEE